MMYQDKFVVAIKVGGKILRETKDLVHLPFGSEFSVLVKNLNSRRAKFTLHIDGTDVLDGTEIIVNANSEVEMKRFIRNGNMDEGNAFKFIERTQAIEDGPRGIKMDDGVVRVQFWFEKELPTTVTTYHRDVFWNDWYYPYHYRRLGGPYYGSGISGSIASDTGPLYNATSEVKLSSSNVKSASARSMAVGQNAVFTSLAANASAGGADSASLSASEEVVNDVGITVPGSKVEQKFQTVYGFNAEPNSYTIVLRMAGTKGKVEVAAPVTVKTKNICSTCSHTNKAKAKFCSECGTSLNLV
jgi:hypothetical protein